MERLTNKFIIDEKPIYTTPNSNITSIPCILTGEDYTGVAIEKLGKLEDVEEKSGIDLLTLFKAQTQGIWRLQFQGYDENKNAVYMPVKQDHSLFIDFKQKALVGHWIGYDFEDYKKLKENGWALTEEELLELLPISKDELLKLVNSIEEKGQEDTTNE